MTATTLLELYDYARNLGGEPNRLLEITGGHVAFSTMALAKFNGSVLANTSSPVLLDSGEKPSVALGIGNEKHKHETIINGTGSL